MTFHERADILALRACGEKLFSWIPQTRVWCRTELTKQTNIFSKIGISARTAVFTMYRRNITQENAIRFRGQFCFITNVIPNGIYLTVTTALVNPVLCNAIRIHSKTGEHNLVLESEEMVLQFPGILTEKYLKFSMDEPHNANEIIFVLVTPKPVQLKEGDIVEASGNSYNIITCHALDDYKNEYEIRRKGEI